MRRKPCPPVLRLAAMDTKTTPRVSISYTYDCVGRSRGSRCFSISDEDTVGAGDGEGEPSMGSKGMHRTNCDGQLVLRSTSCEVDTHGPRDCRHCHRCCKRGFGGIRSCQSRPRCHHHHLHSIRSLFTPAFSKPFPYEPHTGNCRCQE